MSFKAKKVEVGKIPKWMVEKSSPSISRVEHEKILAEAEKGYKSNIEGEYKKVKKEKEAIENRFKRLAKATSRKENELKEVINFWEKKDSSNLSEQELIFLLNFIKEASFKGEQLEYVFQVTLKLQDQYKFLQEQKDNDTLI